MAVESGKGAKRIRSMIIMIILLAAATVFLYIYQPLSESLYAIGDSLLIVFAFMALVSGLYAYKFYGFRSIQGKALLLLSVGIFFWFLGELMWGIYEVALGIETPIVSIADVFWITGYPFFMAGLYYVARVSSHRPGRKTLAISLVLVIAVLSVSLYLSMPDLTDSETSLAEKIATAGYTIGDALIIGAIIIVISFISGTKFIRAWGIILFAFILTSIADFYYMYFTGVYESGNLIDILWDLDYLLVTLGFFYHRETVKEILGATTANAKV